MIALCSSNPLIILSPFYANYLLQSFVTITEWLLSTKAVGGMVICLSKSRPSTLDPLSVLLAIDMFSCFASYHAGSLAPALAVQHNFVSKAGEASFVWGQTRASSQVPLFFPSQVLSSEISLQMESTPALFLH